MLVYMLYLFSVCAIVYWYRGCATHDNICWMFFVVEEMVCVLTGSPRPCGGQLNPMLCPSAAVEIGREGVNWDTQIEAWQTGRQEPVSLLTQISMTPAPHSPNHTPTASMHPPSVNHSSQIRTFNFIVVVWSNHNVQNKHHTVFDTQASNWNHCDLTISNKSWHYFRTS